ncbi:hypothetical protein XFUD_02890 [Xylella fastidiosa]|uniref:Uncharacterized protein n=1 Tax=Xylella fastidiosa (strain 9a5c) TaxID=160492 RepID=Q9PFH0_XYLFA|nr:hypothetical protein [Xylella fastidiosa]AAF83499.1 hypothetical protein XF_0689 [Xylella fastidiosa 9a5c]ALQ94271.1 hypothetical protein XFUD_02890 [Xylella fastidiosa]ALQ97619.1 hypothetical protein XFC3_09840 [Xylella fastidiosa]ALR09621.2 hypothetical protein XFFB_10985 [Xylella fastidiosa]ETE30583.1 hypothetical protein B398_09955 [Xylella fastidiosa 32]
MSSFVPTESPMRSERVNDFTNNLKVLTGVEHFTPLETELIARLAVLLEDYEEVRDALHIAHSKLLDHGISTCGASEQHSETKYPLHEKHL